MTDPTDDLVYDGELGWIDPDPSRFLASIGVEFTESAGFFVYDMARRGHSPPLTLWLPRGADWAVLEAIIHDARQRAQDAGRDDPLTESQRTLDDLAPDDPIMASAWFACLNWSLAEPGIVAEFRGATGNTWVPPANILDRMIDEACGADYAFLRAFAEWHNANVWGCREDGRPIDAADPEDRP